MSVPTRDICINRIFDAPRETVWQIWTAPDLLKRWYGPKDYTTTHYSVDLRVGGKYLNCMRASDGVDYWGTGTYLDITDGRHLVFTDSFADQDGNIVSSSVYGMTVEWPAEVKIDLTFEDMEGKTRFTLKHIGVPAGQHADLCEQGWNESFDRLDECLAAKGG